MKNAKFIRCTLLGMMLLGCTAAHGQSMHFSQIDVNPTLFNPGYSGFYDGQGRFGVNYRNQWASVSEPYQTFSLTAEMSLYRNKRRRHGFNIGLYAYTDVAGALKYGTTAADIILSFYQGLSSRGNNLLSAAFALGPGQSGFNADDAITNEPEVFEQSKVVFLNVGVGLAYYHQFNSGIYLKIGVSGQHLNRPKISYLDLEETRLERKWNGYIRSEFRLSNSWSILPMVALQIQNKYNELIYGIDFKWYYDETANHQLSFLGGLAMRHNDAVIISLGMEYNAFLLSLSYDANISKLIGASRSFGAFEIGLVYRLNRSANKRTKSISCPVF